jgi:hypothetical protein
LPEHVSPELLFIETRWSSLVSYGMTLKALKALKDFLPIDEKLNTASIRNHTLQVATVCEVDLGEEPTSFVNICETETGLQSDDPVMIGMDGGYIRQWEDKKKHFEVIVGKSIPTNGCAKCFGFVQTFDTKPKLRLFDHLQSQGIKDSQDICFISDGEKVLRQLRLSLSPQAQHMLDWFHITMRITVISQYIKGMAHLDKDIAFEMQKALDLTKWNLWHGKIAKALDRYMEMEILLYEFDNDWCYLKFDQIEKTVYDFKDYIEVNKESLRNYGEYWRNGKIISSAFVESLVNQLISKRFAKKQQMQWTPKGAHLLLQMRVKTLNGDLSAAFRKWYPSIQFEEHFRAA